MINKNFYLENLSAFDILIKEEREKAEAVIYRVYCILQRDKIWLAEVATEEEIDEEDVELLVDIESELNELDETYQFRFSEFYEAMQAEVKKRATPENNLNSQIQSGAVSETAIENEKPKLLFNNIQDVDEEDLDDDDLEEDDQAFDYISDEEIDKVTDYILASAKTRFNYEALLEIFPGSEDYLVDELFLFPVISGKANDEEDSEIAENCRASFKVLHLKIAVNNLAFLVKNTAAKLEKEIEACALASQSLQIGDTPDEVIAEISQILY